MFDVVASVVALIVIVVVFLLYYLARTEPLKAQEENAQEILSVTMQWKAEKWYWLPLLLLALSFLLPMALHLGFCLVKPVIPTSMPIGTVMSTADALSGYTFVIMLVATLVASLTIGGHSLATRKGTVIPSLIALLGAASLIFLYINV